MAFDNPPFRLRILKSLAELLQTITPDNGFQCDLSDDDEGRKRVVRGRNRLGDDDPDTIVSILEPPTTIEQIRSPNGADARSGEWEILIQGWMKNEFEPGHQDCDLVYFLADEVQKVLFTETRRGATQRNKDCDFLGMGGKVYEMSVGAPVVRPTEEISGYGVFYLILRLKIVEDTTG
jgi:hypothetical protein